MTTAEPTKKSPKWNSTTKTVVGLTLAGIVAALAFYFRSLIGPLLLVFVFTYLLHPVVKRVQSWTRISWRGTVNIFFVVLIVVIVAAIGVTGVAVVQEVQSLIVTVQAFIVTLPELIADLSTRVITIGPFTLDMAHYDLSSLLQQALGVVQGLLGRIGGLVSTLASGAASTVGWGLFVLLISYFILVDAERMTHLKDFVQIPDYEADLNRLGRELGRIWNGFLRGQVIISLLTILVYSIVFSALGVPYAVAIALLAGLARFIPYLGPAATWMVLGLVAFFAHNWFGMQPGYYTLMVVGIGLVIDQIFDNLVAPRIIGEQLGVHPAVVLVAAIIAANLIGIIGVVLAAPTAATLKLFGAYLLRKLFDQETWPEPEQREKRTEAHMLVRWLWRLRKWWQDRRNKK
jgi:predicted PurR-regulated permease PerM